jgi:hypothetical protein
MNNLLQQGERLLRIPNYKEGLEDFTNPEIVQEKAFEYLGNDAYIYPSSRKTKKYMILAPERIDSKGKHYNSEWIHFGEMGMTDYTKHMDDKRLKNFKNRNRRWAQAEVFTPAWLSYYLLW